MTLYDVVENVETYISNLESVLECDDLTTVDKMNAVDREGREDELKKLKDGMSELYKIVEPEAKQ